MDYHTGRDRPSVKTRVAEANKFFDLDGMAAFFETAYSDLVMHYATHFRDMPSLSPDDRERIAEELITHYRPSFSRLEFNRLKVFLEQIIDPSATFQNPIFNVVGDTPGKVTLERIRK